MDPIVTSSLIGAGGSLLGGLFGRRKAPSAYDQTIQGIKGQAEGARKYGEEFGFNPLTLLGASAPIGAGVAPENYMGQAIADAALIAADGIAKNAAAQKLEQVERQNAQLKRQLTDATLRPKVGGLYDQRKAANGPGADGFGPVGFDTIGDHARPIGDSDPIDKRREVDAAPVNSHTGFSVIDNPYLGKWYVPTLDGDEALQWYDLPSLALPVATTAGISLYQKFGQAWDEFKRNREVLKADREEFEARKSKDAKKSNSQLREYWTHPHTGFSAPRVPFGF